MEVSALQPRSGVRAEADPSPAPHPPQPRLPHHQVRHTALQGETRLLRQRPQ